MAFPLNIKTEAPKKELSFLFIRLRKTKLRDVEKLTYHWTAIYDRAGIEAQTLDPNHTG